MTQDEVCGMRIDEAKAAGTSQHQGRTYYFCSPDCKSKFDAEPARYAASARRGSCPSSFLVDGPLRGRVQTLTAQP